MTDLLPGEPDWDIRDLSWEELLVRWDAWLCKAQATSHIDEHLCSHGVFRVEPGWKITPRGVARDEEHWRKAKRSDS